MYAITSDNKINLYGTIWSGDGPYIVNEIKSFLKSNTGSVIVHLHTPGGSVFDGNLIYNELSKVKDRIEIVIDGLVASMGTIIMLAGSRIKMAENAYLMIHAPSGSANGNAKDFEKIAKLLKSMEGNFIDKYKTKTDAVEEKVKSWMDGDNWFSAKEALAEGLIDEIVDTIIDNEDLEAYKELDLVAMCDKFPSAHLESQKPKQNKEMKLNSIVLGALCLAVDASEDDINTAIQKVISERDAAVSKLTAQKEAQIKSMLDGAIASGKILPTEREQFEKLAKSDFDLAQSTIAKLQGKASIADTIDRTSAPTGEGREKWTFDDWRKKDPSGLLAMKKESPEAYANLTTNAY